MRSLLLAALTAALAFQDKTQPGGGGPGHGAEGVQDVLRQGAGGAFRSLLDVDLELDLTARLRFDLKTSRPSLIYSRSRSKTKRYARALRPI